MGKAKTEWLSNIAISFAQEAFGCARNPPRLWRLDPEVISGIRRLTVTAIFRDAEGQLDIDAVDAALALCESLNWETEPRALHTGITSAISRWLPLLPAEGHIDDGNFCLADLSPKLRIPSVLVLQRNHYRYWEEVRRSGYEVRLVSLLDLVELGNVHYADLVDDPESYWDPTIGGGASSDGGHALTMLSIDPPGRSINPRAGI